MTKPIKDTKYLKEQDPVKKALFLHGCCGDGYNFLKQYKIDNPNTQITPVNMLNVRDFGYDVLYDIKLEDLRQFAYIVELDTGKIYQGNK